MCVCVSAAAVCVCLCVSGGEVCVCGCVPMLLPPLRLSTATVAARGAEFGLFEWGSRSVCRGAGLAGWTLRGRRSQAEEEVCFL